MEEQEEKIREICALTGLDAKEGRGLLELSNWDMQAASSAFFDNPQEQTQKQVNTLSSLAKDKKQPQKQSYYTGGSTSGMLVEDPNMSKEEAHKYIENILKKAKEGGQQRQQAASTAVASSDRFSGSGYTLGSEDKPSSRIESKDKDAQKEDQDDDGELVTRTLTFWRNGFSIEDGPLLSYEDPKNKQLLEAINEGRAPLSLFNLKLGQQADVNVAHRMNEDYVEPKKVLKPFTGSGQRLGSIVPGDPPVAIPSSSATPNPVSQVNFEVDNSKPVTSIQIRLADGTRLVAKFNLSHTVADLITFIRLSRPESAGRRFQLQTQFPSNILDNEALTLNEAGLKNATVFQKNL